MEKAIQLSNKILNEIEEYSKNLTYELGKKYSVTTLKYMRLFYEYGKL